MSVAKLNRKQKDLYDKLQQRPRHLGQLNELRLITTPRFIWLLVLFGLSIFGMRALNIRGHLVDVLYMKNPETTQGTVQYVNATELDPDGKTIYEIGFSYELTENYEGFSYSNKTIPKVGETVTVEYNGERPNLSRVTGTTYGIMGWVGLAIEIYVPIVMLFPILWQLRKVIRWRRFLTQGVIGAAWLREKKDTGVEVNGGRVYKLRYHLIVKEIHHDIIIKSNDISKLVDDDAELVLYEETNPKKFQLLDQLPIKVQMEEPGTWSDEGGYAAPLIKLAIGFGIAVPALMLFLKSVVMP